jgi:hypothetical protein
VIWTSLNPYPHHRCWKILTISWNLTLMNFCAVEVLNVSAPYKFKVSTISECNVETSFSRSFCSSSSSGREVFSSCYSLLILKGGRRASTTHRAPARLMHACLAPAHASPPRARRPRLRPSPRRRNDIGGVLPAPAALAP